MGVLKILLAQFNAWCTNIRTYVSFLAFTRKRRIKLLDSYTIATLGRFQVQ